MLNQLSSDELQRGGPMNWPICRRTVGAVLSDFSLAAHCTRLVQCTRCIANMTEMSASIVPRNPRWEEFNRILGIDLPTETIVADYAKESISLARVIGSCARNLQRPSAVNHHGCKYPRRGLSACTQPTHGEHLSFSVDF